ncbi:MAG: GNAT family N-acetyltransferase [Candidatus Pacebacteria bacterium]|nr:GNAT family N-acetyltransferase [Candidatus Paceibacterota bacterium]
MEENPLKNKEKLALKIEIATEKDWEEYKKIRCEAIDTDPEGSGKYFKDEARVERNQTDNEWKEDLGKSIIVLARNGSEVIGIIKGVKSPNSDELRVWRINSVFLKPNFRKSVIGENIAERMLKTILDEEKRKGAEKVRLWVLVSRGAAIKLYEKFGFEKLDEERALPIIGNDPKYLSEYQIMELDLINKEHNG